MIQVLECPYCHKGGAPTWPDQETVVYPCGHTFTFHAETTVSAPGGPTYYLPLYHTPMPDGYDAGGGTSQVHHPEWHQPQNATNGLKATP